MTTKSRRLKSSRGRTLLIPIRFAVFKDNSVGRGFVKAIVISCIYFIPQITLTYLLTRTCTELESDVR